MRLPPWFAARQLDRYPAIAALLKPVFAGLTLKTLQDLNERVAVEGAQASAVAADYVGSLKRG